MEAQPKATSSLRSKLTQDNAENDASAPQDDEEQPHDDSHTTSNVVIAMATALEKILERHQMPDEVREAINKIVKVASKVSVREGKKDIIQITMEDARSLRKDYMEDLSTKYKELDDKLTNILSGQERILKETERITKEAMGINAATKELESKVTKVTDTADQIASTTRTYKDALLNQPSGSVADLKLMDDLERRAKQILVNIHSDDLVCNSTGTIKDKANAAINEIEDEPERPDKVEVEAVITLRSKAVLLQLNSKQAANWLRDPGVETKFTEKFAKDSFFVDRKYNIIIPRTPIVFDPSSEKHLREIEECNNLDLNTIEKARWIKPVARRREGQTHAYAILTIKSPIMANQLIRGGITICGAKSSPTKLKHEPIQCMRCREWGHIAAHCDSSEEICGACAENHKTSDCKNRNKWFCFSCKSETHASWDRRCPEFIRRCEIYNERYPENKLPFFPTDEEWTLTLRPDRIPSEDRFPQRYAVNSLPTVANSGRAQQQGQQSNRQKRQSKQSNLAKRSTQNGNNNSIEKYLTRSQPSAQVSSNAREEGELSSNNYLADPASNSDSNLVEQMLGNTVPGGITGWN